MSSMYGNNFEITWYALNSFSSAVPRGLSNNLIYGYILTGFDVALKLAEKTV
jgi:hypothetical protein